ncbi:MAG: hypothetical protein FWC72_02465 [Oscillospiraceae bacterium]|nr:hypothetical protein [Oscillospiraceae bacterium]
MVKMRRSGVVLLVFLGAVLIGLVTLLLLAVGARAGGHSGHIVDGRFYYFNGMAIYRYDPAADSRTRLLVPWQVVVEANMHNLLRGGGPGTILEWAVDERGIYYRAGANIYLRPHDGGERHRVEAFPTRGYLPERQDLPRGNFLTGTDDFLIFYRMNALYLYCLELRDYWRLHNEISVYTAVTDGVWLFTANPSQRTTDSWLLVFDDGGRPIAMELIAANI